MSHKSGDLHPRGRGVYAARLVVECGLHGKHEVTLRARDVTSWELAAGARAWWKAEGYPAWAYYSFRAAPLLERPSKTRAMEDVDLDDPAWPG